MSETSRSIPSSSANCDSGFSFFQRDGSGPRWNADLTLGWGVSIVCPGTRTRAWKWAELLARLCATGKAGPIKDSLIAATAVVHGLTVVTRDRSDFANAGVRIVHPFVD